MPSPSTSSRSTPMISITSASPLASPSESGPGIRVFGVHVPFTGSTDDDDNALPGPGPSTVRQSMTTLLHAGGGGAAAKGLRRRRLLSQVIAIFGLIMVGGMWYRGSSRATDWSNWSVQSSTSPSFQSLGDVEPDTLVDDILDEGGTGDGLGSAHPNRPDTSALTGIEAWGSDLSSGRLLNGLALWPPNPSRTEEYEPLSSLGQFADEVYKVGPLTMGQYSSQLYEFARNAFSPSLTRQLEDGLRNYLGVDEGEKEVTAEATPWDSVKEVWQTDKDTHLLSSVRVGKWREGAAAAEGWKWQLLTDPQADKYIKANLSGSKIEMMWDALPSGILRSDALRYILLLLEGGIYSDTDTAPLKGPSSWGQGSKLWRDGDGWLGDEQKDLIQRGRSVEDVLGKPSVIVGVEADVGTREDWFDWWPRPIQIVQWTIASAPSHPIALSAMLRIVHATAEAIDWVHEHVRRIKILNDQGKYEEANEMRKVTVLNEPKDGGPLGIMAWTGPGVWTDAVLSYLRVKYGMQWTDLRGIKEPLRVGDVVVLPVTGFSPGVGNFGAQATWHREAMVEHAFSGSWRTDQ